MALLDGIKQWLATIKDKREELYMLKVKGALERMNNLQVYNPYRAGLPSSLYNDNKFTIDINEAYVWYQGDETALGDFYNNKTGMTDNVKEQSYFWYASPTDGSVRRVHSGLPKLISDTWPTVLFGNGYGINVTAYLEDGKEDVERQEQVKEMVDLLVAQDGINLKELMEKSASVESWAGDVAWKIAIDTTISPYPLLMASDPRNYEPIRVKGVLIGVKFKDYKEIDNGNKKDKYIINEIYTTDRVDGTSLIVYTADKVKDNGKIEAVQLSTVADSEIQALLEQNGVVVAEDGLSATIRFNGLKGILAWHKPNKINNADGYQAIYGESDYKGNYSNFDSFDEALSVLIEEARTNKDIRYIPTTMLAKDENGRSRRLDEFVRNYKVVEANPDQNAKNEITFSHFADKTVDHLKKAETFLGLSCAVAKISPLTLGITSAIGVANSDKTLQERSRVTAETRKKKLELWEIFLERVIYKLCEVYNYMWTVYPEVKNRASFEAIPATEKDITVNVTFPDYNEMGLLDRAKEWVEVLLKGGISTDQYVETVYGDDMTAEQKLRESNQLKIEKNIGINNPEALNINDLTEAEQ